MLTGAGWLSVTAFHDLRHVQQIHEMKLIFPQRTS